MNTKHLNRLGLGLAITATIMSCKKDEISDPIIPNEQEIITTLTYSLTPMGGGNTIQLVFLDMDGDGPQDPVITVSDSLAANSEYVGELILLNETITPADTINSEILGEAEDHQFFFHTQSIDLNTSYTDADANGNPIGLSSLLTTGNASQGTLSIVLRHEPDKTASGVAQGDIGNAGGETDIEAVFDVTIQ